MQDLALCCLRISKVHHLIQQLVNDDEVVPDTLLLQHFEVFGEHLHDLVEEEEDLGGICVSFGQCEDVEVTVADIEVLDGDHSCQCIACASEKEIRESGGTPGQWLE